jgi:hypothetical protein
VTAAGAGAAIGVVASLALGPSVGIVVGGLVGPLVGMAIPVPDRAGAASTAEAVAALDPDVRDPADFERDRPDGLP